MRLVEQFTLLTKCKEEEMACLFLERAEKMVLLETNRSKLPNTLEYAVMEIAIILYNQWGMEGESSRNEGGLSLSFVDLPAHIRKMLFAHRLARVSGKVHEI